MATNSNTNSAEDAESLRTPTFPPSNMPPKPAYANSNATLTSSAPYGSRPDSSVDNGAHIERELSTIDAMECGAAKEDQEHQAMLRNRDNRDREAVTDEKTVI